MKKPKNRDDVAFEERPGGGVHRAPITTLNIDQFINIPRINRLLTDLEKSVKNKYKNLKYDPKDKVDNEIKSECSRARKNVLSHLNGKRQDIENYKNLVTDRHGQNYRSQRTEHFEKQAEIEKLQARGKQEERLIQLAELEEQMRITEEDIQYYTNQRIDYEKAHEL